VALLLTLAFTATSARAEASTHCVKATKTTTKPKHSTGGWTDKACTAVSATHEGKYERLASFSESEEQQLKALLKYVSVQASGVAGKPTVQFSGANVQVVNGEGKTASTNGAGNLVIGYDENKEGKHAQSGSHDLIVGTEQSFTSFGGIVGGYNNAIVGEFSSVLGGSGNATLGEGASVSGGGGNEASGNLSSVSGGGSNIADSNYASVGGGGSNLASGEGASVSGGEDNQANGSRSTVSGGEFNHATGAWASVTGGLMNKAGGERDSISGGLENKTGGLESWVGGGEANAAEVDCSSIFGGKELKTTGSGCPAIP
jgi:hypothetical protein